MLTGMIASGGHFCVSWGPSLSLIKSLVRCILIIVVFVPVNEKGRLLGAQNGAIAASQ